MSRFFALNSYRSRVGKGGSQGIYRTVDFSERWNQYAPGFIGASSSPRWVPYILATSPASTDDGAVRVGGFVQAAGFTVGDGVGVAYTMSGGAGQLTRSTYLATSDLSGARFDTRAPFTLTGLITLLDVTFPAIETGVELFVPYTPAGDKSGVRFLVGYDAGGYYSRVVDLVNGGGQLNKTIFGPAWVPYATLIAFSLVGDGTNITMTAGPAAGALQAAGNLNNLNLFLRGGTIGVHHNWNSAAVDKAAGISALRVRGSLF